MHIISLLHEMKWKIALSSIKFDTQEASYSYNLDTCSGVERLIVIKIKKNTSDS